MKVLLVHNSYQLAGGEDEVLAAEAALLESHGHEVLRYLASNHAVTKLNVLSLGQQTIWNRQVYNEVRELLRRESPRLVHVHNTFPLISPAVCHAARAAGAAVVQSLHNYRLLCPNGILFRDGRVCEDCVGKAIPLAGVAHACYRQSRVATAAVVTMIAVHRAIGTWTRAVDLFLAPSEFAREKFIAGGIAADRIVVKPHFVDDAAGVGGSDGNYALYVGRLSPEKGVDTLLDAWEILGEAFSLKIAGDGPLADRVASAAQRHDGIEWLRWQPRDRIRALMRGARFLIFPSVCYETFGLSIAEAFSVGLPVIASDLGSMSSIIDHAKSGLLFRAGDAGDLAQKVAWGLAHPEQVVEMRSNARAQYEARFTPERNYEMLMAAYDKAIDFARDRRTAVSAAWTGAC